MTGPNREVIKRRLGHVFASITGNAFIRKADMAESALGWSLSRGLHSKIQSSPSLSPYANLTDSP
jgi:hypothetical protein